MRLEIETSILSCLTTSDKPIDTPVIIETLIPSSKLQELVPRERIDTILGLGLLFFFLVRFLKLWLIRHCFKKRSITDDLPS